jgi:hypothetical protein
MDIANKIEDGIQTHEIRKEMLREQKKQNQDDIRRKMIQGQLNAQFGIRRNS